MCTTGAIQRSPRTVWVIHHMALLSSLFIWQQPLIASEKAPPRTYKNSVEDVKDLCPAHLWLSLIVSKTKRVLSVFQIISVRTTTFPTSDGSGLTWAPWRRTPPTWWRPSWGFSGYRTQRPVCLSSALSFIRWAIYRPNRSFSVPRKQDVILYNFVWV